MIFCVLQYKDGIHNYRTAMVIKYIMYNEGS